MAGTVEERVAIEMADRAEHIPKRIWLQWDGDVDAEGVTWCPDKIDDSDIEYVRPEQLKADLANANRLYKQAVSVNADRLEQMLSTTVHKENDQLKADLAKYGEHKGTCMAIKPWGVGGKCDCGYDKAKERWE